MTTKELLNLDYRDKQNKQIIQKALLHIKPLSKFSDEEHVPHSICNSDERCGCKGCRSGYGHDHVGKASGTKEAGIFPDMVYPYSGELLF